MTRLMVLSICALLLAVACKKDRDQTEIDREKIEQYLAANNLTATAHPSGLYYIITEPGTGANPPTNANVTVRYKGSLLDGTVFDQTPGNEARTFPLQNLIQSWQIGIPLVARGGKITLFSPSALAYGSRGVGIIPANSVLIFEIELVNF
ncbi:MAG TPA: FKBP-type peptidyl-prolyl cis-trans isomerase [Saprospiraceae bacterium]|nr:FKBP-type peptidyl-prolyl cis-trans isomerase [Saprospiraceae bacterium]